MNGKYFTFLTLFLALSISLNAQKSISVANRAAEKCLVTNPGQSASASHSHLVQTIKSKANPSERANQKFALAEEFTNASCPPCAAQNPAYNALLQSKTDKVIAVKYQVWFPGYDPMYETNTSEVRARWTVYEEQTAALYADNGLGGVPSAFIDGYMGNGSYGGGNWASAYYGAPVGYNAAVIDFAAATESPLDISVSHEYNANVDSIFISVLISNNSGSEFTNTGYQLHAYLLEQDLKFPTAPGTNGEAAFEHVFRKAASNINGDNVIPATIADGDAFTYTYAVAMEDYFFIYNQIEAVAFIQHKTELNVMNAALSAPVAYPDGVTVGDASISNASTASSALCPTEYTAEPKIRIKNLNPSQEDITQVTAAYSINGVIYTKEFTDVIAYNQTKTLSFGSVSVPAGSSIINVALISFNNGAIDDNTINNATTSFSFNYLSEQGEPAPVAKDFEASLDFPENLFIGQSGFAYILPINAAFINAPNAMGGYAKSENSILFNFYGWNPSETVPATMTITHNKVNMPSKPIYSFDYAYAGYTASDGTYDNDKFEFYYSLDCGATWTLFKSKQQATLKTSANQGAFFAPKANQWKSDTTRLDDLAGVEDVVFQIRATSDYGNNGYLDNLFIGQDAVSAVNTIKSFENVSVFPNPMSDVMNIKINAFTPGNISIKLLDYTGRLVQTLNNNQLIQGGSNNLSFNVGNFANGMYMVQIENKEGVNIYPVSIMK